MKKIILLLALFISLASISFAQDDGGHYEGDGNYYGEAPTVQNENESISFGKSIRSLIQSTSIGSSILKPTEEEILDKQEAQVQQIENAYKTKLKDIQVTTAPIWQNIIMILVGLLLVWLAIAKGFEPLLLIPIGMGGILANVPIANIGAAPVIVSINDLVVTITQGGFLGQIYALGIETGLFPLFIFMGVGAMTDFGPLIANPKTALLGAAAQFGIFFTVFGAIFMSKYLPIISFTLKEAAAIGIIGGADGPTAIFLASKLAPQLLGAIAVAAYSYMALVPIIQPPIMRLLTSKEERMITMKQLRPVTKREKVIFPLTVILLVSFLLPDAAPLIGALMFGNLVRECGVAERLSKTLQNEFINIVTILLGLAVGSKLAADKFLRFETLGIIVLGLIAFSIGTAAGLILAKIMNLFLKEKINPLIGAAGVSAVPMAARVANKVGLEANPQNFLLMHAMGPNVSGVIGSAVAAGVLLAILG